MKRPAYTGILAQETPWPVGRMPVGQESLVIQAVLRDKLAALLTRYRIHGGLDDPGNGWKLALALAGDHVRGFAPTYRPIPKPAHRPPTLRAGARDLILLLTGARAKVEGKNEREAIRRLGARWRKAGKSNWSDASLWSRYQRIRQNPTAGMTAAAKVLAGST